MLRFAACLTLLVTTSFVFADAPKPRGGEDPALRQLPRLIEQLGDSDFHKREAAEKAILAIGVDALPRLREAAEHRDPEVRQRVGRLVTHLDQERVIGPKRVTLESAKVTPGEAFDTLARHTGYRFYLPDSVRDDAEPIPMMAGHLTFWEALDRVCRATGTERETELPTAFETNGKEERGYDVRIRKRGGHAPFVHYDGAFRVTVATLEITRKANFRSVPMDKEPGGAGKRDNYCLTLDLAVEPRLLLAGVGSLRLTEAVDDEDNKLVPQTAEQDADHNIRWIGIDSLGARRNTDPPLLTALVNCSRTAKKVTRVRGSVPVVVLSEDRPPTIFDQPLTRKDRKFKVGDRELNVQPLERQGETNDYLLRVAIDSLVSENLRGGNVALFERAFELLDADGKAYALVNVPTSALHEDTSRIMHYQFRAIGEVGPPAKLIHHDWKPFRHEVKFAFKDIPLP